MPGPAVGRAAHLRHQDHEQALVQAIVREHHGICAEQVDH